MALLESISFKDNFHFRFLINYGYRLTTPHIHGEYEIIYVEKGSINLGVEKELFHLEEKELFILRPYVEHYIVPDLESVRYVFQFDKMLFEGNYIQNSGKKIQDLNPLSRYWREVVKDEIQKSLSMIKREHEDKQESYEIKITSELYNMFAFLTRYECNGVKHKESKKISHLKEVFQYVTNHYKEKIYIEDIADHLGYSTEYFSRFFKKNTGLNFTDFLLDYRLSSAKWDLLTTDDSIHQIIFNNGFSNTATFYRNFKEFSGFSPKEFRMHFKK